MIRYAFLRVAYWFPVLLLSSAIVFALMRLLPGDPINLLYPPEAQALLSEEDRQRLRSQLGLDRPLPVQYVAWGATLLRGDLGISLRYRRPVLELVRDRAPRTAALVVGSTALAVLIALPVGFLAATRRGSVFDWGASALALLSLSVPAFALGTLLVLVFAVRLRLVPSIDHLLLPTVTLGLTSAGILVRYVRSGVLEELPKAYVQQARAKGLGPTRVQRRHVLPNAIPDALTVLAAVIGYLLGGAVVVEQVFGWPGLGLLMFESITGRDYAVVQALALLSALVFSGVNLAADLARAALDPRVRAAQTGAAD